MTTPLKYILLGLLFTSTSLFAQTAKNIFDGSTPITYLGIDFTQAKVIGEKKTSATTIRNREYPAINNSVINQSKQFNFAEALGRTEVTHDITQANARNKGISTLEIKSGSIADYAHLSVQDVGQLVSGYNFTGKTGIGLLFVVDGMSNLQKAATVYVTFINLPDKRVLLTERLEGKAAGFGFRNYWLKAIENVLVQIRTTKYIEWKKKY